MSARNLPLLLSFLLPPALAATADAQLGHVLSERKIYEGAAGSGGLQASNQFGSSVASLGDLDGDGILDLAVGERFDDTGSRGQGALWVLFMNADGSVRSTQKICENTGGFGDGLSLDDNFGIAVCTLGDLDGDGLPEVAVGAEGDDDGGGISSDRGATWILFLNADGTVKAEQKISATEGAFPSLGLRAFDHFGSALAPLGDFDGDGIPDLAAGLGDDDDGGLDKGAVWILLLNTDGTVKSGQKISAFFGDLPFVLDLNDHFGNSLANLGDLDGDGVTDLAAVSGGDDDGGSDNGAVWILFLRADGTLKDLRKISATQGGFEGTFAFHITTSLYRSGLVSLGDMDGDGNPELAVGCPSQAGVVWILFLASDGSVRHELRIGTGQSGFTGPVQGGDWFGHGLAVIPDGTGGVALAVGALGSDDGPGFQSGALWILGLDPRVRLDFETDDGFGTALANGQAVSTPPEFGYLVSILGSGPNAGAALFESTSGGPNDPSQDPDLLVGSGNVLILQTDQNTTQTVPGVFDRPNDDSDGGTLAFTFTAPVAPAELVLIDIDAGSGEASLVVLTDKAGRARAYTIPPDWTGDILNGGAGRLTLDLTTLAPQAGFGSSATAVQDAGFDPQRVVSLELTLGGSGAVDDLRWLPSFPRLRSGPVRPASGSGLPTGSRAR